MMLTTDAFLSGSGEMERLRASSSLHSESAEKAGKAAETAANGNSFPEMLESIQNASYRAEDVSLEGETAGENQISSRATVAEGKSADGFSVDADLAKDKTEGNERLAEKKIESLDVDPENTSVLAFAPDVALLLQEVEFTQFSSITVNEKAGTKVDLAGALEKEASSAVLFGESALDTAEERGISQADIAANESARVFAQSGAKKAESASTAVAETDISVSTETQKAENTENGQEKAYLSVRDLRSAAKPDAAGNSSIQGSADSLDAEAPHLYFNADPALENAALAGGDGSDTGAAGSFSLENARGGEGTAGTAQNAGLSGSFAEKLAAELRSNAPELVRAGQIVLRNGGEGTIRLALHPETLGAVRIHLEMSGEKRISGKITVASREAWDAFSESMESLVAAFADEGFDSPGFDLSWAGRDDGGAAGAVSAPFYASSVPDVMPGEDLSDDYSMAAAARRSGSLYAVDLFA